MKFKYKAQKKDQTFYEAEREATDKFALAKELRALEETLIFADEVKTAEGGRNFALPFFGRVKIHEKIIFTRNLGGMIGAGLTLTRALSVLERQTKNKKFKGVIAELNLRIGHGESLSQALAAFPDVFPPVVTSMVRAGEEGGNLSLALAAVAGQLDKTYFLQRKLKGALMYPAVVVSVMIVVGIIMFIFIVPQLTSTFKEINIALPLSTRIIIGLSNIIHYHLLTGLGALAVAVALAVAFKRSERGKRMFDSLWLHLPVISGMVKEANASRTGSTLSSLLSAGVEVITAVGITAEIMANVHYREVLLDARGAIEKGELMSSVFKRNEHIYPPFLGEMVAVGEETGKLSVMLREVGDFFEKEVEQRTKDLSTIIEPVLMVVVGVLVGFFALAMITPMYSLMNSI